MLFVAVLLAIGVAVRPRRKRRLPPRPPESTTQFLVFLRSQPVGREEVVVLRLQDGYVVRGTSRLGPPIDITSRIAEVTYDLEWRPTSLHIDGVVRGQDVELKTTFAGGKAINSIAIQGKAQPKDDPVALDTVVLPNAFLGSYAALASRLQGKAAGRGAARLHRAAGGNRHHRDRGGARAHRDAEGRDQRDALRA